MFRSKTRDIIIPQSEHAKLSGMIAALWGNDEFERPDFNFDSFVAGVALHDEGHGYFDMDDIGGMDPGTELASMRRLVDYRLDDPIADTIANFHILRLLHFDEAWSHLAEECEAQISEGMKKTGISRNSYLWVDRITRLCDSISFNFCFGEPVKTENPVFPRQNRADTLMVSYDIDSQGRIVIDPWPLKVSSYEGYILGYEAAGYPDELKPVLVYYTLSKKV